MVFLSRSRDVSGSHGTLQQVAVLCSGAWFFSMSRHPEADVAVHLSKSRQVPGKVPRPCVVEGVTPALPRAGGEGGVGVR